MTEEIIALLLASLIGFIPNLVLKIVEKTKSKEELGQVSIQAADISLDMLKDTIVSLKEHVEYLNQRYDKKKLEMLSLEEKINRLEKERNDRDKLLIKLIKEGSCSEDLVKKLEEIINLQEPQ